MHVRIFRPSEKIFIAWIQTFFFLSVLSPFVMDTKRIIVVVVFVLFLMHVCRVQAGGGGDEIEGDERSVDGDKRPLRRSDRVRDNREGKQQAPVCSSEISDPELEADKNDEEDNPSKRKRLFIENEPPLALTELVFCTAEQWLDYSTFELKKRVYGSGSFRLRFTQQVSK